MREEEWEKGCKGRLDQEVGVGFEGWRHEEGDGIEGCLRKLGSQHVILSVKGSNSSISRSSSSGLD